MPGYDRTGPAGMGPRTGWGRGLCGTGMNAPRFGGRGMMGGLGRGGYPWGGGRGRCFGGAGRWWGSFGWGNPAAAADEAAVLKAEIAGAREAISAMEARLSELEKKD